MDEPPEDPRVGLGLPPLALQAILDSLTPQARNALLISSRSVRHEVLLCFRALSFTPGAKLSGSAASRSKQLQNVLEQRWEPLRLKLDLSRGPQGEQLVAMLAEIAGTSRPVRDEQGTRRCCVDELILKAGKGAGDMHGACGLLGAAFPHITSLRLVSVNLDVQLMSGLAACSRLTKLDLGFTQPTAELTASAHQLPAWLPHVRTLACNDDTASLAVASGLSTQLQHLEVHGESNPSGVAAVLKACTQLVSLKLFTVQQATLEALVTLPNLREVKAAWCSGLASRPVTPLSVHRLTLDLLDMAQAVHMPLANVQQLVVEDVSDFELQPSPAATGAAMHAACSQLALVPQLQVNRQLVMCNSKTPRGGPVIVPPDQCGPHLEAALAGMQPLAGKLPSLLLCLQWLGSRCENVMQNVTRQLGPEVLRGLHAAGLGDSFTSLGIAPFFHLYWAPSAGFWAALPDVLPQLQTLELHQVAPVMGSAAIALAAACARLQRSGRHLELVFKEPLSIQGMREMAG